MASDGLFDEKIDYGADVGGEETGRRLFVREMIQGWRIQSFDVACDMRSEDCNGGFG